MSPVYDLFLSLIGYRRSVQYFVSQLSFNSQDSIRVLDAGCGTGLYSMTILETYPRAQVIAFDLNKELIERVKDKSQKLHLSDRIRAFSADIQDCLREVGDQKFDLIITSGVLEYVPPEKTVEALADRLVPGGYFFNSPARNTMYGKAICRMYGCRPYSRTENMRAFNKNMFSFKKIITLPTLSPASFKEGHLFKKN